MDYSRHGLFPPYREKVQAGIDIADCRGEPLYRFSYPQQLYAGFSAIPPLLTSSLLFIENRQLLADQPLANPAVDWPRFVKAALTQAGKVLDMPGQSAGGSTLATQLEKYRHSPSGLTLSAGEKIRQMASASVRAYQGGPETLAARQRVVLDYLNSVPLSAVPGHGEVHGMADGLRVWYGADFERTNRLLAEDQEEPERLQARGQALREVVSLMIAQRRPSFYLSRGREELEALTDSHLRLLGNAGVLRPALGRAALEARLGFRDLQQEPALSRIEGNKGVSLARARLSSLLQMPLYDLDRLDLAASSSLQGELQQAVTTYLHDLAEPAFAEQAGLFGERLLSPEKTREVRYSFTLFERTPRATRCACRPTTPTSPSASTRAASWSWAPPPSCGCWPPTSTTSPRCTRATARCPRRSCARCGSTRWTP